MAIMFRPYSVQVQCDQECILYGHTVLGCESRDLVEAKAC
jgi:hypothetical protein